MFAAIGPCNPHIRNVNLWSDLPLAFGLLLSWAFSEMMSSEEASRKRPWCAAETLMCSIVRFLTDPT